MCAAVTKSQDNIVGACFGYINLLLKWILVMIWLMASEKRQIKEM